MSLEEEIITKVSESKAVDTIAKQLWPSMLFLVVMSLISLFGSRWWSSTMENQLSIQISYWFWFLSMLIITGFGIRVLMLDAAIQSKVIEKKNE